VAASTAYKRLFLRGIKWDAGSNAGALLAALTTAARGSIQQTRQGRAIIGTSAAGRSVSFLLPSSGQGVTQTDIAELISELLDLYESSNTALVSAGIATPTTDQIYTEMLSRLVAVTEFTTDYSGMRVGYGTAVEVAAA
jgi:hypothetical protein